MGVSLAVVTLANATTGLPEDSFVNTLTVTHGGDQPAVPGEISTSINGFYDAIGPYLSSCVSRVAGTSTVDLFDIADHLDGSPHGSPYFSDSFAPTAATGADSLPWEVALAITLHGAGRSTALVEVPDDGDIAGPDPGTARDRPKQRRTGRIYVGPFHTSVLDGTGAGRPWATFLSDLEDAFLDLCNAIKAITGGGELGVWSRANESVYALEAFSVDNAFDTQRRRGIAPSLRGVTVT